MKNYEEIQNIMNQTSKIEYPKIPNLYPNTRYARMLYNDFAGSKGELTAVTQYIYEHINYNYNPELSKILLQIAIEEMRHIDILGEIIKKLGENPIYVNSEKKPWTSENVTYHFHSIDEMLEYNVMAEDAAIIGYKNAIKYTKNIYLKNIFERIILDEEKHKEIFTKLQTII